MDVAVSRLPESAPVPQFPRIYVCAHDDVNWACNHLSEQDFAIYIVQIGPTYMLYAYPQN